MQIVPSGCYNRAIDEQMVHSFDSTAVKVAGGCGQPITCPNREIVEGKNFVVLRKSFKAIVCLWT